MLNGRKKHNITILFINVWVFYWLWLCFSSLISTPICSFVFQIVQSPVRGVRNKFKRWSNQYWNLVDALAITLFFVGFGLRIIPSTRLSGHVVYAIDIMFWIIRVLNIFSVNKHLGPYVVMIWKMVWI